MDYHSTLHTIKRNYLLVLCILLCVHVDKVCSTLRCRGTLFANASSFGSSRKGYRDMQFDLKKMTIPKRFDSREEWRKCTSIRTIYDQGDCGGCWAFASASVMADRICIATNGEYQHHVSIQDIMECCKDCVPRGAQNVGGCEGGYIEKSFEYWQTNGVVSGEKGCKPMEKKLKKNKPSKVCRSFCTRKGYKVKYAKDNIFAKYNLREANPRKTDLRHIQAEILNYGPVVATMDAYGYIENARSTEVLLYKKKLAQHDTFQPHAIKLIGWDVIKGTPVWIMANSWGSDWCNRGFCYIRRGKNDFGMEGYPIVAGQPQTLTQVKQQRQPSSDGEAAKASATFLAAVVVAFLPLNVHIFPVE